MVQLAGCWAHGVCKRISPPHLPFSSRLEEADYTSTHMHELTHITTESDRMDKEVGVYRAPENTSFH